MAYLIDGTTPIPTVGDLDWGGPLNTAISAIDNRFVYSTGAAAFQPASVQFHYLGADRSSISSTATNPFGVAPNLTLNHLYRFEYYLRLTTSTSGTMTLGWASTAATQFQAEVLTALATVSGTSTSLSGVNEYASTANTTITGTASSTTFVTRIRGMVVKGTATARFPLQISISAGTITPKAGSWLMFTDLGLSTAGTANITFGDVA